MAYEELAAILAAPERLIRHGLLVLEERTFDPFAGRARTRLTMIEPDGTRREHEHRTRVYTASELAPSRSGDRTDRGRRGRGR